MDDESRTTPAANPPPRVDWALTKTIVGDALEQSEPQRSAFIEARCEGNAALLAEVTTLLDAAKEPARLLADDGHTALALAEAMRATPVSRGSTVGRYHLGSALGSGGMGTVFEATDSTLGRKVAIKLLSVGLASSGARKRFEQEAATLARLDHAGIARVYETGVHHVVGQAISVPYFAMEFVEHGRTLDEFARAETPSLNELLSLFARVCDAVHHGHQKGVLHRDIKPANILINDKRECKVIDFGVSRLLHPQSNVPATLSGDLVGTPAYLPPEAFDDGSVAIDVRADVYALGVVFYEILTGKCPFESAGQSPLQIGKTVCSTTPPPLGTRRADCRGDVETIVSTAMSRDPGARYQSVAELGADLRRVLALEPILAKPAPLLRQFSLFAKRNRALVGAGAAILAAVAVGVVGLAVGLARARESERRARDEAARSREIYTFFAQMLRSANPFQDERFRDPISMDELLGESPPLWPSAATPGRAPTVGDLLQSAADRLAESFPERPVVQADMAAALAQTAYSIADPRADQLTRRAEALLSSTYGRDDRRTILARQHIYGNMLVNGDVSQSDSMDRDLAVLRARALPNERDLLWRAWANVVECYRQRNESAKILPLLREMRAELDRVVAADDPQKIALDLAIERLTTRNTDPRAGLIKLDQLLARARALPVSPDESVLAVLFEMQLFQTEAGDLRGALATVEQGASLSTSHFGGMDRATYEWWSSAWLISLQLGDYALAEDAARKQVAGAEAMLGPHSLYTTKAYGRLARVLLAQKKDLAEAEEFARKAIDSERDALLAGDGWALYYEVLWASAIRMQGDADRAARVIRSRMDIESKAGRARSVDWVEIVRATELAQCAMDIAARRGGAFVTEPEVEALLQEAEACATRLGADWPSVKLVEEARARFEILRRRRSEGEPR